MAEKKTTAKRAPAKMATAKKATAKRAPAKRAPAVVGFHEIQIAAYLRAESAGFSGDPIGHWLEAESLLRKSA